MKKRLIIFTLVLTLIFETFINTYYENYTYAVVESVVTYEMFTSVVAPLLVSAGLVFSDQKSLNDTLETVDQYFNRIGLDYQLEPEEPNKPRFTLGDALASMAVGDVVYDFAKGGYKKVVEIKDSFYNFLKSWVDDNYDVGENEMPSTPIALVSSLSDAITISSDMYLYDANYSPCGRVYTDNTGEHRYTYILGTNNYSFIVNVYPYSFEKDFYGGTKLILLNGSSKPIYATYYGFSVFDGAFTNVYGTPDVVDNKNYKFVNNQTGTKTIVVPIVTNPDGQPSVDVNGKHIPDVKPNYMVDVKPEEIPKQDTTGIPQPDIPKIPESDENEKELSFLQKILQQIVGIRNDTATIKHNSNKIAEGVGNGNGGNNDTDIPTDFEWGDFKKFFDIFFIFIYFIIILILILVKLLKLVFLTLIAIPANADLFNQYPTILKGVDYIKNLKVGGLSITVHQAFEYVFMIFFFIFIIKQIRKLYDSFVYEENHRVTVESGIKSNQSKLDSFSDIKQNPDSYENIKFTDYTKGL